MSSLRSRTISRFAARSSGRIERIASDMPGHVLVEHLPAEPLDELVEPVARIRLEEVVVLEAADPLADVAGSAVELVEPLAPPRRAASRGGQASAPSASSRDASSSRRSTPARSSATISSSSRRMSPRTSPSPYRSSSLLAPPLQAVHQVAQAREVAARRVARPPAALHQAAERLGEVALGHHVVGERVQDLVGIEVRRPAGAVPAGVPGAARQGRAVRGAVAEAGREVARVRRVGGHALVVIGGRRSRPRRAPC